MLRPLQEKFKPALFPNLIVGLGEPDDAAVYKLSEEQAIIQTVDFFPPVVDDAYAFGAIAAANALSDIYAMGGEVLFALNLVAFPEDMDPTILGEVMRGGADKVAEAGAAIAGGHSIRDREPKYGLAVTGLVHPKHIFTKGGARVGDTLVLTKPLGVGTITTAIKNDQAEAPHVEAAMRCMMRLNRTASKTAFASGVHSATDITGFGLIGHALEMANASHVAFRLAWDALPFLPGARAYGQQWIFPGGASTNERSFRSQVRFASTLAHWQRMMLFDPETSGGMLAAVHANVAQDFVKKMRAAGEEAWIIGDVVEGRGLEVS